MEKNYLPLGKIWSAIHADNEVQFEVTFQSVTLKASRYDSAYGEIESLADELSVISIIADDENELTVRLCPMTEGAAQAILFATMEEEDLWGDI